MNKMMLIIFCIFLLFIQCKTQNKPNPGAVLMNSYDKQWKEVGEFESKGLPKSALDKVKEIYETAKRENNSPQIIKSIINSMKYRIDVEEDSQENFISELEKDNANYDEPTRAILSSLLAEMYVRYYETNIYRYSQRTEVLDSKSEDIKTWNIKKFITKAGELYFRSLDYESIKSVPISNYKDILTDYGISEQYRPTLYDFLANRAIDFFSNGNTYLTEPEYKFEINDVFYFSDEKSFIGKKIEAKQTDSLKYKAVLLFQSILKFHIDDRSPDALIDINLKRLQFVYKNAVIENKDNAYIKSLEELLQKYRSNPWASQIAFLIASYYSSEGDKFVPETGEMYKPYKTKAMNLCVEYNKKYPDSMGGKNCLYLKDLILQKNINLTTEKVNLVSRPFLSLVRYKNIENVFFRVIRLNESEKNAAKNKSYQSNEELITYYLDFKPIIQWEAKLPEDKDYNSHSVEIKIPAMNSGYYVILTSDNREFKLDGNAISYMPTYVSNISYIERKVNTGGDVDVYIFDRDTGKSMPGVNVQIYSWVYNDILRKYEYAKKERYVSDKNGIFTIKRPSDSSRNYAIEFTTSTDRLFIDENSSQYKPYDNRQYDVRTFFFTDRAIYRPGQTVYFKAIVTKGLDKNVKILPNYHSYVMFSDVNGQKISESDFKTNEYGSFSGKFTAPSDRLNGLMTIQATDGSGFIGISVEEYKRPKFQVVFQPVKESFRLNEKVSVKGNAAAYSGANIDNATVNYTVVRKTTYPYWFWYWMPYPSSNDMQIKSGTTSTDAGGIFTVDFNAVPDPAVSKDTQPVFYYEIKADVVDMNGETHTGSTTVNVGYVGLDISINLPDSVGNGDKTGFDIISRNLNHEYEESRGNITIYSLKSPERYYRDKYWGKPDKFIYSKEEYEKDFPYDSYNDENAVYKWKKEQKVLDKNFDTAKDKKFVIDSLDQFRQGKYILELKTKDRFGNDIRLTRYFNVYDDNVSALPTPSLFYYQPVRITGEPGTKAILNVGSSADDVNILCRVEYPDKAVNDEFYKISGSKKKFEFPIKEENRGNFTVHLFYVRHNRFFSVDQPISVPWTNKELKVEFMTFRDKLNPGQEEEWKLKITGPKGEKVAAEMVASLYDASLNEFSANSFNFGVFPYYYSNEWIEKNSFNTTVSNVYDSGWNEAAGYYEIYYPYLNWFGFEFHNDFRSNTLRMFKLKDGDFDDKMSMPESKRDEAPVMEKSKKEAREESRAIMVQKTPKEETKQTSQTNGTPVQIRKDFNETAFFYPELRTTEKGEIVISFKIPESLTRWQMLGFAHTKDLNYGFSSNTLVTQKDLMVVPNVPRFFRENDRIVLTSKVTNLTDRNMDGSVRLELFDALTMKPVDSLFKNTASEKKFSAKNGQSANVEWELSIPEGIQAVDYRIVAASGKFSDGEESVLPILTNRMLVTESLPLPVRKSGTTAFVFKKLLDSAKSPTLKNEKVTFEYTPNPVWYAIQALPYMMEYPYECTEQTFGRFYANSIATEMANSNPRIKKVFDAWKNTDALLSNLEKNQELKSVLLEETPWVLESKDENVRKKMIGLLFDMNRMAGELNRAMKKIKEAQLSNGGFSWFPGLPDDRYITQYIVCGIGHLKMLKIKSVDTQQVLDMSAKAVGYIDDRMREDYEYLIRNKINLSSDNISYLQIHYLYARSFFNDMKVSGNNMKAYEYWVSQAKTYWTGKSKYMQAMIACALFRNNDKTTPLAIIKSLKEFSIENEEMGVYWKENSSGYYWYQAPIETQAMLIEAFSEITDDTAFVDGMKTWLLKQKQVQDWKTTKATAEACYALLLKGSDWLSENQQVLINIGGISIDSANLKDVKTEEGTGYFKISWDKNEIKPEMGNIKITKTGNGVSWGAMYWQYFEQLDRITSAETPLKLKKKLYLVKTTDTGDALQEITDKTGLKPGDMIKVRIELSVDRDMEYIHMKDARASCLEPINVISSYKYQDGLWYYESTKDTATNFFIPWLKKGTYVFEYPLRITHKGDFSNGITTIQSMYAPEFSSHSEGVRIPVNINK
jgi:hypothetical protein